MTDQQLKARIAAALTGIVNPRVGRDVISAGMVADVAVSAAGEVTIAFVLGADDPGTLVRDARRAVQAVEGVASVKVEVKAGAASAPTTPKNVPAPTPRELPNLGRVIAVSSGKGGVGKSTISVNLAAALAARGHRVGVMDADIYGPNMPRMFGLVGQEPPVSAEFELTVTAAPRTLAEAAGAVTAPVGFVLSTRTLVISAEVKLLPALSVVITRRS